MWNKARWIVACIVLWLIFECWISWEAFCRQQQEYGSTYQAAVKNSCILHGPVMSLFRATVAWWNSVFDRPDAYVALFSFLLFVSTVALWCATRGLQNAANETIKLARQEFLSAHRPKIRIRHVWLTSEFGHDRPITVKVTVVNQGASDAHLMEYGADFFVVKKGKFLPADPKWSIKDGLVAKILTSGRPVTLPDLTYNLSSDDEAQIRQSTAKFYCAGYVHYTEDNAIGIANWRTTAFCRVMINTRDRGHERLAVIKDPDPDYEYQD